MFSTATPEEAFFFDALGIAIRPDVQSRLKLDQNTRYIDVKKIKNEQICAVKYTNSMSTLDDLVTNILPVNDLNNAFNNSEGDCSIIAGSVSELITKSAEKENRPKNYKTYFLTEDDAGTKLLSRESWAPFFKENDSRWGEVINWAVTCPIAAEEFNITQTNIPAGTNADANINRLLGVQGFQVNVTNPGLIPQSCRLIIKQLGNYEEIYNKHLKTYLPERGANKLYRDGGLLVPRLFR